MKKKKPYLFSVVGRPHVQLSSYKLNGGLSLINDTNMLLINGIPYNEFMLKEKAKTDEDAKELLDNLELEKKVEKQVKKQVSKKKEIDKVDVNKLLKDGE